MLSGNLSLTFANAGHPNMIPPWEWLIVPKIMPYHYSPNYFGAISFTLWALVIPVVIYMTFLALRKSRVGLFSAIWFAVTYLVWILITLITDRVTYIYYFYPAIGAICIGLGAGLSWMVDFWKGRQTGMSRWVVLSGVLLFFFLHLAVFFLLSPVNPWPIENLLVS